MATERKNSPPRYYLADDLGSPLRVLHSTGKGECYGYDEFGRDLSLSAKDLSRNRFTLSYTKQGSSQPFGYTGYRYDGVSGSYFAQAREYQPGIGRFMAEDVIRGRLAVPKTLNRYGYCLSNPVNYVDFNGKEAEKSYSLEVNTDIRGIGLMWESDTEGTILMGQEATLEDAYAVITLDKMNDEGCSEAEINTFIEQYINKSGSTQIRGGKDIDYYTNFEDITEKLTMQMIKNEYEYADYPYAPITWPVRLLEFKNNVQSGGPWDLKRLSEWDNSSLYIFDGRLVDRDAPGNIMYGYMGCAYGFPDWVLYYAASLAQYMDGTVQTKWLIMFPNSTLGDDPLDQLNIKLGIDYFKKIHKKSGEECE